jgi:hypothetical protein
MELRAYPKSFWWAVASCAAMLVGGFGPWARVLGLVSVNGTEGDGWIVIGAAVVALVLILLRQRRDRGLWLVVLAFLAAVIAAATAIYDWNNIASFAGASGLVDTSWGIYFAAIGSVSLALASVGFALETRVPKTPMTEPPQPSH